MMRQNAKAQLFGLFGSLLIIIDLPVLCPKYTFTAETRGVPWFPGRTRQRGLSEKDLKRLTRNASACAVLPSGALIQDWGGWIGTWRVSSQVMRWWKELQEFWCQAVANV